MKKIIFLMPALALALFLSANTASAKGWDKQGDSLEHKVFKKVKMIEYHQAELNFSDQEVKRAADLKTALKKDLIKLEADLDIVKLDIETAKKAQTLDVGAINKLIDQKYEIKKNKAKRVFAAYADVKGMFNEGQKAKIKEIYSAKMKEEKSMCPMCMKKMHKK